MSRDEQLQRYHNKGQEDAAAGEYHNPHSGLAQVMANRYELDRMIEDNKEYSAGRKNTTDQTK